MTRIRGVAAAVSLVLLLGSLCVASEPIPEANRIGGFAIGCQAYSFNRYTVFEAIEKTASTGSRVIEFFPGQSISPEQKDVKLDQNTPDEVLTAVKAQLEKYGVRAVAFGVVGLGKDEASNRKVFEFAKKMGIRTITSEPDPAGMDLIEKLVKEYDIRVAIHNHPKQERNPNYRFWDPQYVLSLVKDRDKRIGSCADTGHWVRSGIKPVDALRILKGRILNSHLKDLDTFGPEGHDVPYGTGVSDIKGILTELRAQKYDDSISVEYEYHWETSVPEIAQCIGFVRGWAAERQK